MLPLEQLIDHIAVNHKKVNVFTENKRVVNVVDSPTAVRQLAHHCACNPSNHITEKLFSRQSDTCNRFNF